MIADIGNGQYEIPGQRALHGKIPGLDIRLREVLVDHVVLGVQPNARDTGYRRNLAYTGHDPVTWYCSWGWRRESQTHGSYLTTGPRRQSASG